MNSMVFNSNILNPHNNLIFITLMPKITLGLYLSLCQSYPYAISFSQSIFHYETWQGKVKNDTTCLLYAGIALIAVVFALVFVFVSLVFGYASTLHWQVVKHASAL
jgi:hypothetical protein